MRVEASRKAATVMEPDEQPGTTVSDLPPEASNAGVKRLVARNASANIVRLSVTSLVSILLPAYLTHHLSLAKYGAWVLILQLCTYIAYLDFGVQTAVSKYISEFEAKKMRSVSNSYAASGFLIMLCASALGILLTVVLAWNVPIILKQMPPDLYHDVRVSIVLVGISLSTTLACSVFLSIFLGLQRYHIPMVITIIGRLLFAALVCAAVWLGGNLVVMGLAAAIANIVTSLLQFGAWRRFASHIHVSLRAVERKTLVSMLSYCAILALWSVCALFISGLDVTIVGHYSFRDAGYYAIATSPITLILTVVSALLGPLIPAASALSTQRGPSEMGFILSKATRYVTILLLLTGIPLLVLGYPILALWVGPQYASHSIVFLRVLIIANIVRTVLAPYSSLVVATGYQKFATASPVTEALLNIALSIYLAIHIGAIGVALGTLIGAIVGVIVHFAISMRFTTEKISVSRSALALRGIAIPLLIAVPSILMTPFWWSNHNPDMSPAMYLLLISSTLLALLFAIPQSDRRRILASVDQKLKQSRSI